MKTNSVPEQASSVLIKKTYKVFLVFILSLSFTINSYAHRIETYLTSGCFNGQTVTVDAVVTFAGASTNYHWQFRDNSGNWVCFTNGTNATTINGVAFTVSGAIGAGANNAPLLSISRADGIISPLDNVLVRILMKDDADPCTSTVTPLWGGDIDGLTETKYLRLHIYNRSGDCGGNTPGCIGNILSNGSGYYGGFENKTYNSANDTYTDNNFVSGAGSSDFSPVFAEPTASSYVNYANQGTGSSQYLVVGNPYFVNTGFARNIAPHTGNFQMVIRGAANTTSRAWYKTVTVVSGGTYSFCVWVARVNSSDPNIALKVGSTEIANVDLSAVAIGTWVEVCGTYTVPAGTTSVTISISDKNGAAGANQFTLDDICFRLLGSIGDRVWNDTNKNGVQDAGEVGVAGLVVSLYDANNVIVASTLTDAFGNYLFSGLAVSSGGTNYQVRFSLPAEYKFSPQNADAAGISGVNNSDADITTGRTGTISLTTAAPIVTYADAGIYYAVSARIGDFVWNDINKDGTQNTGEPGIAGVTVMLYTSADVLFRATITSNSGQYLFTDVPAGTYYIKVAPPIGYQVSPKDASSDNTDSDIDPVTRKTANIVVAAGTNDLSFDAGLNVTPNIGASASLGDRVWNDLNSNNLQDANEPGVADVTVQLYNSANLLQATITTDAFGYYMFNGLSAGSYYVKFTLPSGFTFVTPAIGANRDIDSDPATGTGQTGNYSLVADQIRTNVDAGIKRTASTTALGDFVWYDLDKDGVQDGGAELGVPGITVILYNSSNAVVQTTTTDVNGFYLFTGLPAATAYTVGFSNIPAGYGFSPMSGAVTVTNNSDVNPATGRTGTVTTGAAGTSITYADAGLIITPNTFNSKGSIGDKVWNDLNNNGVQDANEPGVQGVTVILYAADGTTVITSTTTDAQGSYIFTNLDAGSYVIGFSGLPSGYVFATQDAGSNDAVDSDPASGTGKTAPVTLAAGEVNLTIDAGVRNATPLSNLGDFVWYDFDSDGIQDAGEPGVGGVSVALLDVNSNVIATTTTTATGAFLFTDLVNGTYYLQFGNLPSGYIATAKGASGATVNSDASTTTLRTDGISLPSVVSDRTWDLGIRSTTKAAIGDFVWNDLNRNGVQDAGEPGVAGITVTLYDNTGAAIASAITDAAGFYFFPNVNPGTYTVGFSTIPANAGFTTQDAGSDVTDSDVIPSTGKTASFTLAAGQVNTTIDAGLVTLLAAVGNYVWRDALPNGTQDASEVGVPGITVTLYTSSNATIGDADDAAVASAVTDARGYYFINNIPVAAGGSQFYIRFTDLQANNTFTIPLLGGTSASNNSKVTTQPSANGRTGFFTLTPGQIYLDVDAGLIGVDNGALPLHHLDLKAVLHNSTVDLTWIAENEMNTTRFVIQRSIDGVNYSDMNSKDPVGPVNIPTEYKSTDDIQILMSNTIIYYRIKAEDNNARYAYSNIVTVRLSKVTGIQVWPNPFVSEVRISYNAAGNTSLTVRIVDNVGKTVIQNNVGVTRGLNQFSVNGVETLPSGIYLISITDNNTNERFIQKLMK